jgi:ParB family chromosome partitioning protein
MLIAREASPRGAEVLQLDPSAIKRNPDQPRKSFPSNELDMLKASISQEGLLQPILVRRVGDSHQLVAGERRLRASQDLGLKKIPALEVKLADERLLEVALIENVQRENLNPIELAQAYRDLMEGRGWTQEVLAQSLGVSRAAVSNSIRLLELPEDIQDSVVRGRITMGHAKVLLSVSDPGEQRELFEKVAEDKLSVRELEGVRETAGSARTEQKGDPDAQRRRRSGNKSPHVINLEEQFSERLGTRVRINEKNGRGRVTIEFYSTEDFERLREILLR